MKIYVDYVYNILDYKDESNWVDYGLLIHLSNVFDNERSKYIYLY